MRKSPELTRPLKRSRQGNHYLVRVYECSGSAGQVSLELPFRVSAAREVDFNGQARAKKIAVNGNPLKFEVQPWEIVTLEVT